MLQAIFFDLDGTLLDTAFELTDALNQLLSDEKRPSMDIDIVRPAISKGSKGILETAFDFESESHFEETKSRYLKIYEEKLGSNCPAFDGIEALLQKLNDMNMKWGIITNKPQELAKPLVAQSPLFRQSKILIGGDTLKERKPHPLPIQHACKFVNIKPEHTLYVGDADTDIISAKLAGAQSVLAEYGYLPADLDIADWAPDHRIAHPLDLLPLIEKYAS